MSITLGKLRKRTNEAVVAAGPRYTPGIEPGAPNISIGHLDDVVDALSLADGFRDRLRKIDRGLARALESSRYAIAPVFQGRVRTPQVLREQLERLANADGPEEVVAE
jgi:hypothetical protein